ncbi:tetratricopeptide repeat protein [Terasakiella pusilla]|uniref:tetratricopeptide repeat protein n=1 Tax=Terasakiella pusilla TaxID=64973 RepID=UPI003AA822BD
MKTFLCTFFMLFFSISSYAQTVTDAKRAFDEERFLAAFQILENLSAQGNPAAMYGLGQLYRNGNGVAADRKVSCDWFEKAAKQNVGAAMFQYGHCWMIGKGRPQRPIEAERWYRKAADLGVAEAVDFLNETRKNDAPILKKGKELYKQGELIDAHNTFLRIARTGNEEAMYYVAKILLEIKKDSWDEWSVCNWFKTSSEFGYEPSKEYAERCP